MSQLSGEQLVGGLAILAALVFGVVAVAGYYWRVVRVAEQNAVLKKAMIERGMAPEDIERIVLAGDPDALTHKLVDRVQ